MLFGDVVISLNKMALVMVVLVEEMRTGWSWSQIEGMVSWNEARSMCIENHMAMTISGFFEEELPPLSEYEWIWVGGSRIGNREFRWIDGSVVDRASLCQGEGLGDCLVYRIHEECFAPEECATLGYSFCDSRMQDIWLRRDIEIPLRCEAIECYVVGNDSYTESECWSMCLQVAPFGLTAATVGLAGHCCCGGDCCATDAGASFFNAEGVYAGQACKCVTAPKSNDQNDDDSSPQYYLIGGILILIAVVSILLLCLLTMYRSRLEFRIRHLIELTSSPRATLAESTLVEIPIAVAQLCPSPNEIHAVDERQQEHFDDEDIIVDGESVTAISEQAEQDCSLPRSKSL